MTTEFDQQHYSMKRPRNAYRPSIAPANFPEKANSACFVSSTRSPRDLGTFRVRIRISWAKTWPHLEGSTVHTRAVKALAQTGICDEARSQESSFQRTYNINTM